MKRIRIFLLSLLVTLALFSTSQVWGQESDRTVKLWDGLGDYHHFISTNSPEAQRYFDQGLIFAYGFNHAEAERSFREAARLDPDCAMCYWGIALVLGPNINAPMEDQAVSEAYAAMQKALELRKQASKEERAYIEALQKRYYSEPVADRKQLDLDYANAMREIAQQYPDDLDAATLFAEALMDTSPWNYWTEAGEPKPEAAEILAILESVLKRYPDHIGANHLYIHAVEASPHPEWGLASADRLRDLAPAAGHLVHMPSHIYIRVGQYHNGSVANERAIKADQAYIAQSPAEGIYPLAYMLHNYHFLWATATMEGRSATAIQAAEDTASRVDRTKMLEPGWGALQHYYSVPLYALTRFGKWEEILREPAPEEELQYPTGVWHYARGIAYTAKGQQKAAAQELEKLKAIAAEPSLEEFKIWGINSAASLLHIASEVLSGELAAKEGNYQTAIAHLETGVRLEDALTYTEPADWYYPVRQSLGAVLLAANQPAAAEKVYREDLKRYPNNGWSLFGLQQSLRTQEKTQQAEQAAKQFGQAWAMADVKLSSSRL
ncbi:hypothetical protein [Lyngbya aestuarii]|uniref:hypothetical protein n=1 Tax=Lyngbya aestuarii TaxID=118322 RepID=UPI00403DC53C